MTDLQSWRNDRGAKPLRETLADAKELQANEKLKSLQELTATLKETERLAALVAEVNKPKN